jgi:hypothetical protein
MRCLTPLALVLLLLLPVEPSASTLLVPDTYSHIQLALNAASTGDTVLVSPGTYYERLIWPSTEGIKMLSRQGAEATIIDGGARESACGIYTGVDTTTIIRGFTFTNGDVGGS